MRRARAAVERLSRSAFPFTVVSVSAALVAVHWLSRLPASPDGLAPRRFGAALALAATSWARSPAGRVVPVLAAYAALLASAGLLALRASRRWGAFTEQARGRSGRARGGRLALAAAGVAALGWLARLGLAAALDVIENVAFPPESMSLVEPLAVWAALAFALAGFLRACASFGDWALSPRPLKRWGPRPWLRPAAGVAVPAAALWLSCAAAFDAGRSDLDGAARLAPSPSGFRRVWVFATEGGKPAPQRVDLELGERGRSDYGASRLAAAEAYAGRRPAVYRRAALRFLYLGRAFEQDAAGVERALDLGARLGDPLARALLLERLRCAAETPVSRASLEWLADERRFLIGPRAAAKLAQVYSLWGRDDAARLWLGKAQQGPSGLPAGLVSLPSAAAAVGGVEGRIEGLGRASVGLYCRPDEFSPYALGPAQLVASAPLDARGRFRFERLPLGRYFLAVVQDAPSRPRASLRVVGRGGDLVLTRPRPRVQVQLRAGAK